MLNDFVVDSIEKPIDDGDRYIVEPIEKPTDDDEHEGLVRKWSELENRWIWVEPLKPGEISIHNRSDGSKSDEENTSQKIIDTALDLFREGTDAYENYLNSQTAETKLAIEREITAQKRLDAQMSDDDDDEGLLSSPWLILGGIAGLLFLNSRRR